MAPTDKKNLFFYLLFLTGFYLLLEISFFIQSNKAYLGDFNYVSSQLNIPLSIIPGIAYFISVQLLLHFAYCVIIWAITISVLDLLHFKKSVLFGINVWCLGIITALVANQLFFPNSKFAELTEIFIFNNFITKLLFAILLSLCGWLIFLAIISQCLKFFRKPLLQRVFYLTAIVLIAALISILFKPSQFNIRDAATPEKPNIILIGVDSLRPDFLGFFGSEKPTPFFDYFLTHASVFSDAITPLARTFPAWISILTGTYPRESGVRYDLAPQKKLRIDNTLSAILRDKGYETVYATDETRFSNIDENLGFDQIIAPPTGLNDFLIGTFNDFPLSNLIVNTSLGKWLFPYSYANRPVLFTYQPQSFLKLIRSELKFQRTKPLFLAVHFCLPHFPYAWANLRTDGLTGLERYQASIIEVDKQVKEFFALLKRYDLLKYALVVLLSDHGEALELPGDRITEKDLFMPHTQTVIPQFYPPSLDKEEVNQSAGHGTDVLGLPQYHILLAFKLYGLGSQKSGIIAGLVSLIDIKATILEFIKIKTSTSGNSLAKLIQGEENAALSNKIFFLESDFSPEAMHTVYPDTRQVLLEGVQFFEIDSQTTRLTIKDDMGKMIIHSKQYAVILNEWMLALYPQNKNIQIPIFINLTTGEWTNDLYSQFAKETPAFTMLAALKTFYQKEIRTVSPLHSDQPS